MKGLGVIRYEMVFVDVCVTNNLLTLSSVFSGFIKNSKLGKKEKYIQTLKQFYSGTNIVNYVFITVSILIVQNTFRAQLL